MPEIIRQKVKNNAGGVYNHNLYFSIIGNDRVSRNNMSGDFKNSVVKEYGTVESFLKEFKETALAVFGPGYANVVIDRNGMIKIINT